MLGVIARGSGGGGSFTIPADTGRRHTNTLHTTLSYVANMATGWSIYIVKHRTYSVHARLRIDVIVLIKWIVAISIKQHS